MELRKEISFRFAVLYGIVLVIAVVIIAKIFVLQVVERSEWEEKAGEVAMKNFTIEPNRGDICAIDGRVLASSVPYYRIHVDLTTIKDDVFNENIDALSDELNKLFDNKSAKQYKIELIKARQKGSRYHLLKRSVSYTELKKLKEMPIFNLGQFKGGLIAEQLNRRVKPFSYLASRTIGYLVENQNREKIGRVGLEGAYENELNGIEGMRIMQKLSGGIWMPVNTENEIDPQDGYDLITTIDINIQDIAERELYNQLKLHDAAYGTAVLMEVETGEIRAISNLTRDTSSGSYKESFNYAVGAATEPGSTFKLASIMVALEDEKVDIYDSIETGNGRIKYYDRVITDSHHGGYGKITVKEVFEKSSNVGVSKIITDNYSNDEERFINRLYSMNLHEKLGLEIKGEGSPVFLDPSDSLWSGVTLPSMSIGYSIQLTPLQTLAFYNAVANNGKMVKPKFVKALSKHGKIIKTFDTKVINPKICSDETLKKAHILLKGVVENGTARNLKNNYYKIAGKTGTARIARGSSGYSFQGKSMYQASFVGYFPADKPKYSCIVVVNSPSQGVYYGNVIAGNVFKKIADKVYATGIDIHRPINIVPKTYANNVPISKHGFKPELDYIFKDLDCPINNNGVKSNWVLTYASDSTVTYKNRFIQTGLMPNVIGMGGKDVLYILENFGLQVNLIGKGRVVKQTPGPGVPVKQNTKTTIILS